jgi:DNA-binding protein HU-beta
MASIPTQDEVLAATRKSQEAVIAAVKTWLETVRTATPKLTSAYAPLADKLAKLRPWSVPFADRLPTPADAVAGAYHLAEQLLASQRRFAEELVKATAPLRPGHSASAPETPSPNAWQEAVTDRAPETVAASAAPKAVPAPPAAESTPARPAAESTPAPPAAESTPARPAPKTTAAKTTAAKRTPARPASKTTTAKRTPARPAPKGTDAG